LAFLYQFFNALVWFFAFWDNTNSENSMGLDEAIQILHSSQYFCFAFFNPRFIFEEKSYQNCSPIDISTLHFISVLVAFYF
jgi:hypothetical protein